jgi:uncharacterized protein YegP (UPF0339 family)
VSRYEIRRTDAGWHAVFVASNGKTCWTTETYRRRRTAENAIETITGRFIQRQGNGFAAYVWTHDDGQTEVRYVNERVHEVARPGVEGFTLLGTGSIYA